MTLGFATLAIANESTPDLSEDQQEILRGLSAPQKRLSPKYFYDERGSELFERICELPEYYPTRIELELMDRHLDEIADLVGPRAAVIEFGAGSNRKARRLLDRLQEPTAYVPVEISADYLIEQARELSRDYPDIHVQPVLADFTRPFELPEHPIEPAINLVFFPGSTIGNFTRQQACDLLEVMRFEARSGGALLIGVDLRKDARILRAAYNDSQGVTAQFNLNVLQRLNYELDANFDLDTFEHLAVYDETEGRIEMRLVSRKAQSVAIVDREIEFARGEYIITEYSHKFSLDEFADLARRAGLEPQRAWVDDDALFSVHYLTAP